MSTVATADTRPHSFKDVWLIAAGHGLTHWYTATFYVLLPLIGKELGLSYSQVVKYLDRIMAGLVKIEPHQS